MRTLPAIAVAVACAFAGCNGGGAQTQTGAIEVSPCHVGGCSGEVCSSQPDVVSACMYRPEYACFKNSAVCEPQADGNCGWTQTEQLMACMANYGK